MAHQMAPGALNHPAAYALVLRLRFGYEIRIKVPVAVPGASWLTTTHPHTYWALTLHGARRRAHRLVAAYQRRHAPGQQWTQVVTAGDKP